jgi:hypothetical protein
MNDQELMTAVRHSVREVHMDVPAGQIVSRSRAIRTRSHRRLGAGVAAVAAAGSVALGLTLSGAFSPAPQTGTGTIRTASFTLTSNSNGTDTLTVTNGELTDPAALQRALAEHGIPALVKINTICQSNHAPPLGRVLTVETPDGTPVRPGPHPVNVGHDVTVINRAAMPAGTELFLGYFYSGRTHAIRPGLIYTHSYTCGPVSF